MFLLKYLALGVGYLLAAYGCFMLLGGIGNDHIALPLAGLLLLYGCMPSHGRSAAGMFVPIRYRLQYWLICLWSFA